MSANDLSILQSGHEMENKTSAPCPVLDAALHELGMLSTITTSRKEYIREKLERQRSNNATNSPDVLSGTPPLKSGCERPLQPSQAWNVPGVTGTADAGDWRWSLQQTDTENSENRLLLETATQFKLPVVINNVHPGVSYASRVDQGLDLCDEMHRRSCPARLAQLSAASYRHHHLKPYNIPWRREERVRTKSESAEVEAQDSNAKEIPPQSVEIPPPSTPLFRSRSLEDVRSQPADSEEFDEMSREIQRLRVNE